MSAHHAFWRVEFSQDADKAFDRLDHVIQRRILARVHALTVLPEPTVRLKPLQANLVGLWSLREGAYRVIIDVQRDRMVLLALDLGHRSTSYRR